MPLGKGTYDPNQLNAVYLAARFYRAWFGIPPESLNDPLRQTLIDAFQQVLDTAMDEGVIQ